MEWSLTAGFMILDPSMYSLLMNKKIYTTVHIYQLREHALLLGPQKSKLMSYYTLQKCLTTCFDEEKTLLSECRNLMPYYAFSRTWAVQTFHKTLLIAPSPCRESQYSLTLEFVTVTVFFAGIVMKIQNGKDLEVYIIRTYTMI